MKSTGMIRKLDNLARIVIPVEIRKVLEIDLKDPVEIFSEGDKIILRKYAPGCVFCGEARDLQTFAGKSICDRCMREITSGAFTS